MRIILNFCFLAIGVGVLWLVSQHSFTKTAASNELLAPPDEIKYFALGYNEILADSLWLRVVQDLDTCGRPDVNKNATEIPVDPVNTVFSQRIGRCEGSWVFRMIDAITELTPFFREPYSTGAVILSVAVDDIAGAGKIYDKALTRFPSDWQIQYRAAYHYLFEMGDKKRAAELLIQAGRNGGPYWVDVLAARLYSKSGAAEFGKAILTEFLEKNPEQVENPHIKKRMAEIEADLAAGDHAPSPSDTQAPGQEPAALPTKLPKKKQ